MADKDRKKHRYPVSRGVSLFFGAFALLNVYACLRGGQVVGNLNTWWIDLNVLAISYGESSMHFGFIIEALAGIGLVAWALRPKCSMVRRVITCVLSALLAIFALVNAASYWQALGSHQLYRALPIPLSAVICVIFVLLTIRIARAHAKGHTGIAWGSPILVIAIACALVFPLLQICFFGTTDYRRDADVAVVFGARVYEDGTLSPVLRERMDTAVELYEDGHVSNIIVSGGIEEGGADEAQAMFDYASAHGVPGDAILIDHYGDSTEATVNNAILLASVNNWDTVIATSSSYHMPRIKMLFDLRGFNVLTVPTRGNAFTNGSALDMWREIPAWWYYWFMNII